MGPGFGRTVPDESGGEAVNVASFSAGVRLLRAMDPRRAHGMRAMTGQCSSSGRPSPSRPGFATRSVGPATHAIGPIRTVWLNPETCTMGESDLPRIYRHLSSRLRKNPG